MRMFIAILKGRSAMKSSNSGTISRISHARTPSSRKALVPKLGSRTDCVYSRVDRKNNCVRGSWTVIVIFLGFYADFFPFFTSFDSTTSTIIY